MASIGTVQVRITADTDEYRYALWFAIASTRMVEGAPTPLHKLMCEAGLWRRGQ